MKGYKYRGIEEFERDLNSIINNQIFASSFQDLNDPFEASVDSNGLLNSLDIIGKWLRKDTEDIKSQFHGVLKFYDKVGIYSLSKNYENLKMWAHYSSSSKGYCLEYDIDKLTKGGIENGFSDLIEVEYKKNIPRLKILDLENIEGLKVKLFGTKHISWEDEKEIRLIFDNYSLKNYHPSALSSVYFGVNMSEYHQNKIIEGLAGRDIKFYKSFKEKNSYMFKWQLIHENKRILVNSIDNYSFRILKTNHNQMVENYYVYVKTPLLNFDEINYFLKAFREKFATKISTINLFDSEKVEKLIGIYPLNKEQYLFYADHFFACSDAFEEDKIQSYPYQDFQYTQYGGLNWKKDKFE